MTDKSGNNRTLGVIKVSESEKLRDAGILGGVACNAFNPDDVVEMAVVCAQLTDQSNENARRLLNMEV